jgi:indole-3-glycerol phosphate synthase
MSTPAIPDVLARIVAAKREEVAARSADTPLAEMQRRAAAAPPPRRFEEALLARSDAGGIGLIAEIKRASPSGGLIRDPFDPAELARAYAAGGAACLSVLTDGPFFQGSATDMIAARAACGLPVLRKDFMVDPWQIHESRAMGADCILLIMACLTDDAAQEMEAIARALGMAVLAEVHDEAELDRALALGTRLVGVNNRNLKTLTTDLSTAEALVPRIPRGRIPVAESGLRTPADARRMAAAGARCLLVGEHLLREADVTAAARGFVEAA